MKQKFPFLVFFLSVPVCYFGLSLCGYLAFAIHGLDVGPLSKVFLIVFAFSWMWTCFVVLKAVLGVYIAIWCIAKGLSGKKPKRVFYVTIPIVSLAYIVWRTMYVIVMSIVNVVPDDLPRSLIYALILGPFSFTVVWLLVVTLLLYRRRSE